jgi:hypothetical protein
MFDKYLRYIVTADTSKSDKDFDRMDKKAVGIGDSIKASWKQLAVLGASVVGVGVALKKAFEIGEEGSKLRQLEESFTRINKEVYKTPGLLDDLSHAARGTISQTDLMRGVLTLTAGVSENLAQQLAKASPQLLEIAKASNKLNPFLGETAFLYESITTGIKRSQPLILDNLGIVVKVGDANKKYADSLNKTVEELSAEEKALSLLYATLETGQTLIKQAGGNVDALTDSYARSRVKVSEMREELLKTLSVPISGFFDGLTEYLHRNLKEWEAFDKFLKDTNEDLEIFLGLRKEQTNWNAGPQMMNLDMPGYGVGFQPPKVDPKTIKLIDDIEKKITDLREKYQAAGTEKELEVLGAQIIKAEAELKRLQKFAEIKIKIVPDTIEFESLEDVINKMQEDIESSFVDDLQNKLSAQSDYVSLIKEMEIVKIKDVYEREIASANQKADELRSIYDQYLQDNFITAIDHEEALKAIKLINSTEISEIQKEKNTEVQKHAIDLWETSVKSFASVLNKNVGGFWEQWFGEANSLLEQFAKAFSESLIQQGAGKIAGAGLSFLTGGLNDVGFGLLDAITSLFKTSTNQTSPGGGLQKQAIYLQVDKQTIMEYVIEPALPGAISKLKESRALN